MPNYQGLNYTGSSGYGPLPDGTFGPKYTPPPTPGQTTRIDYPVRRADGSYISILTGKPFSGKDPHSGQMFQNGQIANPTAAGMATIPAVSTP